MSNTVDEVTLYEEAVRRGLIDPNVTSFEACQALSRAARLTRSDTRQKLSTELERPATLERAGSNLPPSCPVRAASKTPQE